MTGVLVADDHPLVRQGLRAVLEATNDLRVLAEAGTGDDALRLCLEHRPDVVLMDLQMPGLHGIAATREVTAAAPGTAVLVLTMFEDDDTIAAAISAGALGYLLKGASGDDIVAAVRAAARGQAVFGAALAERLTRWFRHGPTVREVPFPDLTRRERDILDGVAAGLTNAEIGARLFLSPKTVANNVSALLDKLGVPSRAQAIVRAREAGLGQDGPPGRPERGA